MPKRWCGCTGCPACQVTSGTHGILFDADATRTTKCPGCNAANITARQQRDSTTARGYGSQHQRVRAELLAAWQPGDPCALCTMPMMDSRALDLAHDQDRSQYLGLAHAACNRATNQGR